MSKKQTCGGKICRYLGKRHDCLAFEGDNMSDFYSSRCDLGDDDIHT